MDERQRDAELQRLRRLMGDYVGDLRRAGHALTDAEETALMASIEGDAEPVLTWARAHAERNPDQPEDCLAARILRTAQTVTQED